MVERSDTTGGGECREQYVGTRVGDKYLCVVVKVVGDDAFVLTAYLTDTIKKGHQLWPPRT